MQQVVKFEWVLSLNVKLSSSRVLQNISANENQSITQLLRCEMLTIEMQTFETLLFISGFTFNRFKF